MSTSEEAEEAQCHCNGRSIDGVEIRVSFSMPCKPGSIILQPKCTVSHSTVWSSIVSGSTIYTRLSKVKISFSKYDKLTIPICL